MAKKLMTRDERERARNFSKGGDTKPKSSFSKKKPAEAPASRPTVQEAKPKPKPKAKAKARTNKAAMKSSPRPQPNPNRGPSVNSEAPKLPGNAKSEAERKAKANQLRRNGPTGQDKRDAKRKAEPRAAAIYDKLYGKDKWKAK